MSIWAVDLHGGDAITLSCNTLAEGAKQVEAEWAKDYPAAESTTWVHVRVWDDESGESIDTTLSIDPVEPPCDAEHEWCSPHSVVGGLQENPGVWGSGGGVRVHEVCKHCGAYRITDTWATDPCDGSQGHTSISYREPDDASVAWTASLCEIA